VTPENLSSSLRARAPQLCEFTVAPPALAAFPGIDAIEEMLTLAARERRLDALGFAMLGNLLTRRGLFLDAVEAYRTAAEFEPSFAQAHWACAELSHILRDERSSDEHRRRALALQRFYPDPGPLDGRLPLLLLLRDAPYSSNTPVELIVDRSRVAVHKYYVEGEAQPGALPQRAALMCAFGYAISAAPAVEAALALSRAWALRAIDDPAQLQRTARDELERTLGGIEGVVVPPSELAAAGALDRVRLPALIRPVDTHSGDGLALLDDPPSLREHALRFPSDAYYATEFVDYRSGDGYYRKYRIIFVGGAAYPYHLAIAPRWMVHYQSAPMSEHAWMREEELRFLEQPHTVFPRWDEMTGAIFRAVGLDYFGIDVARTPAGGMLVFEADAAMLVHDEDERGIFAYKRPAVARIREALEALIRSRSTP
jgi:hypothetical protein